MMSKKERKEWQALFKEMREQGLLPPKKKPLNRKKFAREITEIIRSEQCPSDYSQVLILNILLPHVDKEGYCFESRITDLQLVALKIIYSAHLHEKFMAELKEQGEPTYSVSEYYDKVLAPGVEL